MSYQNLTANLAPLRTFDPAAFIGDETTPQEVCDFVLALGLAYDDLRDVVLGRSLLNEVKPEADTDRLSTEWGQVGGLNTSLMRAQAGVIHELLALVRKCSAITSEPAFVRLTKALSKPARQAWMAVQEAATENTGTSPLARVLVLMRNKVAFHYDPREISRGYQERFCRDESASRPYVSAGTSMQTTRFYFADAAVEEYILWRAEEDSEVARFLSGHSDLLDSINSALHELVSKFPVTRGYGWEELRRE